MLVDDRVVEAQHKQIAVKHHVAAKYQELTGARENKRSAGQSEATVATNAAPAPAEVGSELVQQTVATSGTSLDGLVSLRQLREERWAPWSEDEKARVKGGSYPRGTIRQLEKELEAKYNEISTVDGEFGDACHHELFMDWPSASANLFQRQNHAHPNRRCLAGGGVQRREILVGRHRGGPQLQRLGTSLVGAVCDRRAGRDDASRHPQGNNVFHLEANVFG